MSTDLAAAARIVRGAATTTTAVAAFESVDELTIPIDDHELHQRLNPGERARLDQIAQEGYDDGLRRGYADGVEAGRADAFRELAGRGALALNALDAAARSLAQRDAASIGDLDDHVVGFAIEVVGALLERELTTMDDPGREALTRALRLAPDRGAVIARMHPGDVELLGAVGDVAPGRDVQIVADPTIEPGGCVAEVGACRVDAQLSPALDRVRAVLGLDGAS